MEVLIVSVAMNPVLSTCIHMHVNKHVHVHVWSDQSQMLIFDVVYTADISCIVGDSKKE